MSSSVDAGTERTRSATVVEAAVDSLDDALAAAAGGADRLELCGDLSVGGTTPDDALIEVVIGRVQVPVLVMIRPRGGSFVYTDRELEQMQVDMERVATLGAAGFVTGVLDEDHRVDAARMAPLLAASKGLAVTFHRAIDQVADVIAAIDVLASLGVARVLSSGGRDTAREGASVLRAMDSRARGRLVVVAGGGVRAHNVREIVQRSGVREVHLRCERNADRIRAVKEALSAPTSSF